MKLQELTPGIYKVRKRIGGAFGGKHPPTNVNTIRLLRVSGYGEKRLYYLDHDTIGRHPSRMDDLDEFEMISKYDGLPEIGKCKITLNFTDASGEQFSFTVGDAWALRNVFDAMPWLKDPFGFKPRK